MAQIERQQENKRGAAKDKARAKATDDGWKGFVTCELNEQQKLAVKVMRDKALDQVWAGFLGLATEMYKLSMSYDTYHDAYVASATGKDPKSVNAGLTLTGRGGTLEGAVAAFWYKHDVVLEGDWSSVGVKGARDTDEDSVG
jgi:hypothetical protein